MANKKISELTEDAAPAFRADFYPTLDATDTSNKKATLANAVKTASAFVALTDAATVAVNWTAGVNFSLALAGSRTLGNPTNGEPGTWRTIIVTQDGAGNRTLTFDTQYKHPGGAAPTLSAGAADVDVLSILCVTASLFYVFPAMDLS